MRKFNAHHGAIGSIVAQHYYNPLSKFTFSYRRMYILLNTIRKLVFKMIFRFRLGTMTCTTKTKIYFSYQASPLVFAISRLPLSYR